jgi:hypothetical protein
MEDRDTIKRGKHYNPEGIGTITALLAIITISLIFISILSIL